ncbi:MAG TPA: GNAT family N-acetyltransferase [Myxococcales bacterium]|nr:GNAT family N-acetyltransferase [Myxococcales bacterium]
METGPDFREEHALKDGTRVVLRHIRADDATELRRGLARLSPQSRYRRFLGVVNGLSEEQLRYLTRPDGHDHLAIVAVAPRPEGEEGLGVARFVRIPGEPTVAEAAITVIDEAQGKGLGLLLSLALARAAHERGIQRFRGQIVADNAAVRELLADAGASLGKPDGDRMTFDVDIAPTPFAPGTGLDRVARRLLRAAADALVSVLPR